MLAFDICAAPFGNGFFFSWWQGEVEPANFAGCFVLILAWAAVGYIVQAIAGAREAAGASMSFTQFVLIGFLLPLLALWVVGRAVREGQLFSEDTVLAMPLVGAAYNFIFRPPTYYKQDTIAMYRAAVHAAVLEVVDGVMSAKGLRALSPEERQPTLRDFLGKKR